MVKVKSSCPCLIKHYSIKEYGGVDVQIHIFLTSTLAGGVWSASRPGRFTLRYPLDRSLDVVEKKQFLTLPRPELAIPTTLSRLL
jgi:hypothetical protein